MRSTTQTSFLLFSLLFQIFIITFSYAADTLSSGQAQSYPQTLLSNNGEFQFGLMDPGNNTDTYYMGIWFNRVPLLETTRFWVANRDAPFYLFYSELSLVEDGNLVLVENSTTIWSTNLTSSNTQNSTEAVLLDDGNFVLRSVVPPFQVLWQSFDNPTDTLLPGGRIWYDKRTNKSQALTSWKQAGDPAKGAFTLELDPLGDQLLLKNGTQTHWSSGPWDGQSFTHATELNDFLYFRYVENENESYVTYNVSDSSILYRFVMESSGKFTLFSFDEERLVWTSLWSQPMDQTTTSGGNNNGSTTWIIVGVVAAVLVLGLAVICIVFKKRPNRKGEKIILNNDDSGSIDEHTAEDLDLPLFDLDSIVTATNQFSLSNKIGEGGFGTVYKGILPTGEEIAIKRLSKHSRQGIQEFMNEVDLIAKLQHRNLVRLLGCCIHGEENMLIYEYMPNGSLDSFIFDKKRSIDLNWRLRFNIIIGIARGLLYLHRDSRLTIIHRDLKAGNILLDSKMNPKISDFGMAKTFSGDQTEQNTIRVVGTYGYMSPEYATDGLFSMKSDVFSFGVLILEIVSGKKNRGFHHDSHNLNLLGHTWKLSMDNKALELMDESITHPFSASEVLRCIQVGLLCVQKFPEDRPTMESVVSMLDSNGAALPCPKQPGFYTERSPLDVMSSQITDTSYTVNGITDTLIEGR